MAAALRSDLGPVVIAHRRAHPEALASRAWRYSCAAQSAYVSLLVIAAARAASLPPSFVRQLALLPLPLLRQDVVALSLFARQPIASPLLPWLRAFARAPAFVLSYDALRVRPAEHVSMAQRRQSDKQSLTCSFLRAAKSKALGRDAWADTVDLNV